MDAINPLLQAVETAVCGRCGGSGRYSWCQMYKDRCFKCGGKGKVYTARGLVTHNHLVALRSKRADQLAAGDVIRAEVEFNPNSGCGKLKFVTLLSVRFERREEQGYTLSVSGEKVYREPCIVLECAELRWHVGADTMIRVALTAEQKTATLKAALDFQNTLTKKGKARK